MLSDLSYHLPPHLTPALSLGEREKLCRALVNSNTLSNQSRPKNVLKIDLLHFNNSVATNMRWALLVPQLVGRASPLRAVAGKLNTH